MANLPDELRKIIDIIREPGIAHRNGEKLSRIGEIVDGLLNEIAPTPMSAGQLTGAGLPMLTAEQIERRQRLAVYIQRLYRIDDERAAEKEGKRM